jgi:hypothetical protein
MVSIAMSQTTSRIWCTYHPNLVNVFSQENNCQINKETQHDHLTVSPKGTHTAYQTQKANPRCSTYVLLVDGVPKGATVTTSVTPILLHTLNSCSAPNKQNTLPHHCESTPLTRCVKMPASSLHPAQNPFLVRLLSATPRQGFKSAM